MKKVIVFILALAILLSLCACGTQKPQENVQIANPIHEVTVEGLLTATGLMLTAPERVEEVAYSYIDQPEGSPIAQLCFTLDGTDCCYRAVAADIPGAALTDISGLHYEWSSADSDDVGHNSGELHWIEGEQGWIGWYDYAPGILYCLSVSSGASKELLVSLANELYTPAQGETAEESADDCDAAQSLCIKDSGSLTADLDGDGTEDTVTILEWTVDDFGSKEYGFSVEGGNGLSVVEDELYIGSKPVLWLVDIDNDSLPEILFSGDSGSDDYYTGCFKWDCGTLSRIHFDGTGYDGFGDGCAETVENGVITMGAYCYVMGTYGGRRPFTMNDSGMIAPVPDSIWSFEGNETWLTTSIELPVSVSGQVQTLPAGTELLLTAFDGVGTVEFILRDNSEGTIAVNRSDELSGWLIDGKQDMDCFEFLPYAG